MPSLRGGLKNYYPSSCPCYWQTSFLWYPSASFKRDSFNNNCLLSLCNTILFPFEAQTLFSLFSLSFPAAVSSDVFLPTRRQLRGPLRIHRNGPLLILFSLKSPMANNAFHIFLAITGFCPAFRHGKPYRPFSKKCRETAPRFFPSPPFSIGRVSGRFPP